MRALDAFEYAIVRVVPRPERGEFMNAGVIMFCRPRRYLRALIELDSTRLQALAPDIDGAEVERHLALIPLICAGARAAGPIGELPLAERFHWLVAPRSAMIQTSPVHVGCSANLDAALERLLATMVRPPS